MKNNIILLLIFELMWQISVAQEKVYDLKYNHVLKNSSSARAAKKMQGTLSLPFVDDFSYQSIYPDPARWIDDQVYVNDDYAVNKLSYGVATFDGLNAQGQPHRNDITVVDGPADTLTSQLINLQDLSPSDSVFLSFAYQPQGLGDRPDEEDSLILEFKILDTIWRPVWFSAGSDSNIIDNNFFYVILPLLDQFYFNDAFQFRFRNYATITGNNDHWHLDYVHLGSNRRSTDTTINDITVLDPADNFLRNYTSMPWEHFSGFQSTELADSIGVSFRNNYSVNQLVDFELVLSANTSPSLIFTSPPLAISSFPPATVFPYDDFFTSSMNFQLLPLNPDSVTVNILTKDSLAGNIDVFTENDSVVKQVNFFNYFAYDDGTAERAYGLQGQGLKKFAYEFRLNKPDSLRAIMFHFAQVNERFEFEEITVMVWKTIGSNEDTLYHSPQTLKYSNERNGFRYYVLEEPIAVDGTIYIGWQQLLEENMQVGLDLNNVATSKMSVYSNGNWRNSIIAGAPMIRPVVGKKVDFQSGGVRYPEVETKISIYPNPANDLLHFKSSEKLTGAEIFDMQGRLVFSSNDLSENQLNISELQTGIYAVRFYSFNRYAGSLRLVKM